MRSNQGANRMVYLHKIVIRMTIIVAIKSVQLLGSSTRIMTGLPIPALEPTQLLSFNRYPRIFLCGVKCPGYEANDSPSSRLCKCEACTQIHLHLHVPVWHGAQLNRGPTLLYLHLPEDDGYLQKSCVSVEKAHMDTMESFLYTRKLRREINLMRDKQSHITQFSK